MGLLKLVYTKWFNSVEQKNKLLEKLSGEASMRRGRELSLMNEGERD